MSVLSAFQKINNQKEIQSGEKGGSMFGGRRIGPDQIVGNDGITQGGNISHRPVSGNFARDEIDHDD